MEIIVMELSTVLLLAAIILLFRHQQGAAQEQVAVEIQPVTEPAQQTFLNALANLHDNLSSLDQRTTLVERKLDSLQDVPRRERQEHYEAAALLLAAGHDGSRIAGLLDLPLAQVEMIDELTKILDTAAKTNSAAEPRQPAKTAKRKTVTRSAKPRTRPIVLTDIVEPAHAVSSAAA